MKNFFPDTETTDLATKMKLLMDDLLHWKEGIEDALSYADGSYVFDDVVAKVIKGEVHFYTYPECFVIMQQVIYPQHKNYHCFLAAGNQEALDGVLQDMLGAAEALGCKNLTITGRHGWVKRLRSRGWKHTFSTLSLPVNEGTRI
jgi:hypothetical protein